MEVENISTSSITSVNTDGEDDVPLPGFRFHPTDEELVGFYLRRKIEKKPIRIDHLIKLADIYKYDPWDLPKSSNVGDKEGYFFCKRGRKYRNSIRPNRVTGSGFWKATGIDRPIYSSGSGGSRDCIGLKKSLVYYRGSAGKGTKTDWMMHEFRLPATHDIKTNKHIDVKTINTQLEAEVWTLCRIFKRNVSYRKCVPERREMAAKKPTITAHNPSNDASSKTCSTDSSDRNVNQNSSISFNNAPISGQFERKPNIGHAQNMANQHSLGQFYGWPPAMSSQAPSSADSAISSSNMCADINDFLKHADWEDLRSIMDCTTTTAPADHPFYL